MRTLKGIRRVLKQDGVAVLVIGDVADPGKAPLPLAAHDMAGYRRPDRPAPARSDRGPSPVQNKVSRIWGDTKGQATNRDCALVLAPEDGRPPFGPEIIDWDEPYKDGGPDAAHARLETDTIRIVSPSICGSRRHCGPPSIGSWLKHHPRPRHPLHLSVEVAGALTALWSGIAFNLRVTGQRLLRSTVEPAVDRQYPQVVSPPTA